MAAAVAHADWETETPPPNWNGTAQSYRYARKDAICGMKGLVFSAAADARDDGASPKSAFGRANQWSRFNSPGVDAAFTKKAVNLVYFDPAFANAGGQRLEFQIKELCLTDGKPKYQPLQ